jgi:hypothetical protein
MVISKHYFALTVAIATTALAASCQELPETELKARGGAAGTTSTGGVSGNATGGASGNGGLSAGAGTSNGATGGASAGSSMTGGSGGNGGSNGGRAGQGGSAGRGGGSDAGGEGGDTPGGAPGSGGSAGSAGSAGNAGMAGTFSTNRDDFFGEPRCGTQYALCEDFESGTLDADRWDQRGTVDIDDSQSARGTYSAHFHTEDNGIAYITQTEAFPAPNNTYYARIFVRFDTMPTAPAWAHWTVAGAQDATVTDNAPEIRIGGQYHPDEDMNLFGVGTDRGPTGDWTNLDDDNGPEEVPVDSWVCLEWMFDGQNNQTKFWWDGVEHPSLATSETVHGGSDDPFILPDFGSSWFGWWLYQAGTTPPEFDVWIDEIAIDYARIGCEN